MFRLERAIVSTSDSIFITNHTELQDIDLSLFICFCT